MQGSLSDDQRFLQEAVRDIASGIGLGPDGSAEDLDADRAWAVLTDAGFTSMVAESSTLDVVVVLEALGSTLCPAPFLGSAVLAGGLALAADAGDALAGATVALGADLGALLRAAPGAEGVAWDCGAGTVVLALDSDGEHVVAGTAAGADVEAFDMLRSFRSCAGSGDWRVVGKLDAPARDGWLAFALIAVSAEMCGVMAGSLDRAVQYARERKQFDRPIGSFQAVQQLCAEAHVKVEATRSAVYAAADRYDVEGAVAAIAAARVAKAYASDAVRDVAEAALQVHGGIGMTWEFPGHHYLRRAWVDAATLGDSRRHLRAIAADLLATPTP